MARELISKRLPHLRGPWRYVAAFAIVAAHTVVAEIIYRTFGTDRLSMVFLAAVLMSAVTLGSGPAYFAAIAAFCVYDVYLVEPRFQFSLNSAEDILVLIVFLVVAMLTGGLTGRVFEAQQKAEAKARTTGALFRASEEFSSLPDEAAVRAALERRLAEVREDPEEDGGRMAAVLSNMADAAIARSRLAAERAEMETRARTEELRNALLSSISHDLRTPLAAILASATSLREFGDRFDAAVREDLTLTIQEEAERLNLFVGNLLNMTRLESGALEIAGVPFGVAEMAGRVIQRIQRRAGTRDLVSMVTPDDLMARGDPILAEQALANVVENAVRFAPNGSRIEIFGRREGERVVVQVSDQGPGVPQTDIPMLFEKFFRSPATPVERQGTGLGLSITRGLVEAMGGSVWASPRLDGAPGLVVGMDLPEARA